MPDRDRAAHNIRLRCRTRSARVWWGSWLVALLISLPTLLPAKGSLKPNDRLLLIRGLAHELSVAKLPFPAGKHGLVIKKNGKLDESRAKDELRDHGVAIRAGAPVEITAIKFKPDRVVFELNGGHKNGEKWYQHIEIGMGTPIAPVESSEPEASAVGSYVTLRLHSGKSPLTVEEAKQLLGTVLDFQRHSPTVLYSPSEPPQVKEAIKKHQVIVGMDRDAVLSAKGAPDRKVRTDLPDGSEKEDWIYGQPPHVLFVTFNGDSVVEVHQY